MLLQYPRKINRHASPDYRCLAGVFWLPAKTILLDVVELFAIPYDR